MVKSGEELDWAKVAQAFLNPAPIVKYLNIFEYGLAGCLPGRIETPVHDLLFQDRKEALAPRVVAWLSDSGKALFPAVSGYLPHHVSRSVLAATITVKDHARGQTPAVLSSLQRAQDKLMFHVLSFTGSQDRIAVDIADLAKVVKAFAGSNIADIAGQNLKRSFYFKPLRQVLIHFSTRFSAICQRPLPTSAVAGLQAFLRHDAFNNRIGRRISVAPENTADTLGSIDSLAFLKHRYDLLA